MNDTKRDAALLAQAERGLEPHEIGAPLPNPLRPDDSEPEVTDVP